MIDLAHMIFGTLLMSPTQLHVPMPLGPPHGRCLGRARAAGRGRRDWSAILEQVRVSADDCQSKTCNDWIKSNE